MTVTDAGPLTALLLADLERLVAVESPSLDEAATRVAANTFCDVVLERLGSRGEWVGDTPGRGHFLWHGGGPTRVVLLGHIDTVWPHGTLARWPFAVEDRAGTTVATGPGVFDMKSGLVLALHALAAMPDRTGVALLVTTDEEVGSPSSRALIEQVAAGAEAVLVFEAPAGGALKTARKGVSLYEIVVHGRASHAGLEPEKGVNALLELAHQVLGLQTLARPEVGTTVTPTLTTAGTTTNTVPAQATVALDVRAFEPSEQERVDAALRALQPVLPGARLEVRGGINRPPMPPAASAALWERAVAVNDALGLPALRQVTVGGASDGNFTAGLGIPTLDGLGGVGNGAHAEGEHVVVDELAPRLALVTGLLRSLLETPLAR